MKRVINILCLIFILTSCSSNEEVQIPVSKVYHETFYKDLYEEGSVGAIDSKIISCPNLDYRYTSGLMKVSYIVDDGAKVNKGDTIVIFDPSEVKKKVIQYRDELELNYAELEKLKAQQKSDLESLEADYEIAKLSLNISKIQFESSVYESEVKKREIKLNLDKAKISLDRAKEQIENKKKIQKEDMSQKLIKIKKSKKDLKSANETLNELFVTTKSKGLAIIRKNWGTGNKIAVGDQLWNSYPIVELPDLSKLEVDLNINEVDISKIKEGLNVEIKPDAFSDSLYTGKVTEIANLAINKKGSTTIKVFPIKVKIDNENTTLMPGLTVSCRIIIDKIENVKFIPKECVFKEGDKRYVFVKRGNDFKKKFVKTGIENTDYIIIKKGLDDDDKVAMKNPEVIKNEAKKEKNNKK